MIGLRTWHVPAIFNAAFLRYIAPLRDLLYLQLDHNRDLTRETISSVDQLKQLKILGLTGTQITGKECAEILSKLPSLVLIGLSSEQFTDEVAALVRTSPNITMVWLHDAREHQIQQLFAAKQLTQILLWSTHFADSSVWHEAPKHGPNLITSGPFSTYLTDADLEAIAQLPKLRELWLQESTITDSGLLALQNCRTLRALNITKTPVTEISVRCLQTRLPQCRILWDGGVIEPGGAAELKQGAAQ